MLLQFITLFSKLIHDSFFFNLFTIGNTKIQHSCMTLIFDDLSNFIKSLLTVKSSELGSCLGLSSYEGHHMSVVLVNYHKR